MIVPQRPPDELDRLRRLRALNVLDTPPDERFDRYTRIAMSLFQTPIALVTFIDEGRQWFKSAAGLDLKEDGRQVSFCAHTILQSEVFVVEDALRDARFAENPWVLGPPHVRFYAGCPVPAGMGSGLGTVCVMDRRPRTFTSHEAGLLNDLGALLANDILTVDLATRDELTQLVNRPSFLALTQREIERAIGTKRQLTLMRFNISGLQAINDRFGHTEGDRALHELSDALRRSVRATDIAGRIAGGELALAMPGASPEHAERVLALLRDRLSELGAKRMRAYELRYSVGIVELDSARHRTVDDLMDELGETMQLAKREAPTQHAAFWQTGRRRG
ncbi:MAG: sensor domain-containing diguanylate cyclase [Bryobacterales bacterium]|nr:sensor domain-containing diguanylate cyclase [Bryobacterales bacterium]